jgi:hypothetical protein
VFSEESLCIGALSTAGRLKGWQNTINCSGMHQQSYKFQTLGYKWRCYTPSSWGAIDLFG